MTLIQQSALATLALALSIIALTAAYSGASAQGTRLSVDVDPQGNGPTELGPPTSCVSVASGDSFQLDIVVDDVQELLAWEIYFEYDPTIVHIIGRDVRMFQAANPGSSVFDVSDSLPDSDGLYLLSAVDTADPASPDSGSGVLARLTLTATGRGLSTAAFARRDLNDDGILDRGPLLRDIDAAPIGDSDGDTLFDGPTEDAQIAVDMPCPGDSTGPAPSSGDSGTPLLIYILAPSLAAAAVAAISGFFFLRRRRARVPPS